MNHAKAALHILDAYNQNVSHNCVKIITLDIHYRKIQAQGQGEIAQQAGRNIYKYSFQNLHPRTVDFSILDWMPYGLELDFDEKEHVSIQDHVHLEKRYIIDL